MRLRFQATREFALCLVLGGMLGCASAPPPASLGLERSDDLLIVDCLLPGRIRQLGNRATYVTARRGVKIAAGECRIRGGEYVSYDRASLATSLRVWLPRAERGDAEAQTYVGEMFEKGLGVPADHATAATWYRRAAEQNYSRAQINLGTLYEKGFGVPRDPLQALEWYRRASGMSEPLFQIAPGASDSGEVERLRAQVGDLRRQLERSELELQQTRRRIESLQDQIHEGDGNVERERSELERLQQELATQLSEVERLREEREQVAPTIEIIEPELLATRGTRGIRLEPAATELLLVGRIDSPAGLLSLTVNGKEERLEANDLFRARVTLRPGMQRIRLVAIDRAGRKTVEELSLSGRAEPVSVASARPERLGVPVPYGGLEFGRYHALVIGNDDYQALPDLATAVADAQAVAEVLERSYGFTVTLLTDAKRYEILSALNGLRKQLTQDDNLLIYYAGHGDLDRVNQRGHWLPVDAERESTANWISNISITDILNTMAVRQLLVIADSCYSGTLTRSAVAQLEAGRTDAQRLELVRALLGQKARMVLTSGGLEPVLDSIGGGHSDFAQAFLEAVELNQGILSGRELHAAILPRVATGAVNVDFHQVPEYAPIKYAGHESGDFFLVRVSN